MSEIEELRAMLEKLAARVRVLEDQAEITQLVAQYGPAVDSGSGEAAAALWTDDGTFDAIPHRTMRGRDDIVGMVHGAGHQSLLGRPDIVSRVRISHLGPATLAISPPRPSLCTRRRRG